MSACKLCDHGENVPLLLVWLGWEDLNPRMAESESAALPLGDTPKAGRVFNKAAFGSQAFSSPKTHNIHIGRAMQAVLHRAVIQDPVGSVERPHEPGRIYFTRPSATICWTTTGTNWLTAFCRASPTRTWFRNDQTGLLFPKAKRFSATVKYVVSYSICG